ncbi:MAG: metal ABC transporter substrate-binding protein [Thermodesulfobacteriota bacterium]
MASFRFFMLSFVLLATTTLPSQAGAGKKVVLCSTFPVYQITRQLAQASPALEVQLMLPAAAGCPHDYALTPQDLRKLGGADLFIINGQGLEEFLDDVRRASPGLAIADSSGGITDLLPYTGEGDDALDEDHNHGGMNPHLFASPRMRATIAWNIATALGKLDPAGAADYQTRAKAYAEKMEALAGDLAALGTRLANKRVVTQHGVFDYLARDMGLEVVAVVQAHPGQEPSAAEMLAIVRTAREKKAGAVFTEPQYPDRVGQAIAREAGIPAATLDPVATGPEDAPPDHYETMMRQNMRTLERVLGVR